MQVTASPRPTLTPPPSKDDGRTIFDDLHSVVVGYVRLLRQHRLLLIGVPFLSAAVALGYSLSLPRVYEGSVTLAVSRGGAAANFLPFVQNSSIVEAAIQEFGLDRPPFRLTRTLFLRRAFSVEPIRNTDLIVMKLRLRDPNIVAKVLARIAERAIALVEQTGPMDAQRARDSLKVQLDEHRARLEAAETGLKEFRDRNQLEALRSDVDAALGQRGKLLQLSVQIESLRARLAKAESERQAREPIQSLTRTVIDDPLAAEAARQRGSSGDVVGLSLRSEFTNSVYQDLDRQVAGDATELARLEREREQLVDVRRLDQPRLAVLTRLYATESQLQHLETESRLIRNVYENVSARYELARVDAIGRSAQLNVIDPSLVPDRPLGRGTTLNTLLGFAAGLLLAIGWLIFRTP